MKFQEFCNKLATPTPFTSEQSFDNKAPENYKVAITTMIDMMKNRVESFARIDVPPYIRMAFEQEGYEKVLAEKLEDDEIPTGIIYELSKGIYNHQPNELNVDQQAIIKVLSIYICIQN